MARIVTLFRPALLALGFAGLCAASIGCQTHVTHFTLMTTRRVDVAQLGNVTRQPDPVQGKAGVIRLGQIPLSLRGFADIATGRSTATYAIDRAVEQALEHAPGAVAMADVVMHDTMIAVPFLFEMRTCTIRGKPLVAAPAERTIQPEKQPLARLTADQPAP